MVRGAASVDGTGGLFTSSVSMRKKPLRPPVSPRRAALWPSGAAIETSTVPLRM